MAKREIGNDVTLTVGGTDYEITSASYSVEPETSEVQFNSSLSPTQVITSVGYSGSFEHAGGDSDLRDALFGEQDSPATVVPRALSSLIIKDTTHTYTFKNVLVTSRSKDMPADDRTTVSYDFAAEKLTVSEGGNDATIDYSSFSG